jgi:hypothetical protein
MADHSELIAQFISLTDSSTETAEFYLNATNYDIDVINFHCQHFTIKFIFLILLYRLQSSNITPLKLKNQLQKTFIQIW